MCHPRLQEMCVPITPAELKAAIEDMDEDGNGLIELAEFTQYFASLGFGEDDKEQKRRDFREESDDDVRSARPYLFWRPWGAPWVRSGMGQEP